MHDFRTFQPYQHLRAVGCFLLGLVCAFQVAAAPITASQSGNSVTYSSSSYASDAAIAGASLAISAGVVYASQPSTVRTLSGAVAPLVVRAAPAAGAIASAVGSCLGNPLCLVATAAAAAYVANEVGYNFSTDAVTGSPVVTKKDPNVCTVAPCYEYTTRTWDSVSANPVYLSSKALACERARAEQESRTYAHQRPVVIVASDTTCYTRNSATPPLYSDWSYTTRSISPSAPSYIPSTVTELSTAIGNKSNWADNSKITDLLEKIVKNTSHSIPLQVPTVTGPTSIPGTPAVATKADGSKTTTTTTSNLGYYGPRVDVTETTVVQETTPAGVTTTTSTTVAPAKAEEASKDEYDIPQVDLPKATKTITFNAENLGFGGGTCPANVMSQPHGMAAPIKLVDWTSNCNYVVTYAKPAILAMALFAALTIIFVGGKPE